MARKVFGDPGARRTIESILHPLIRSAEKDLLEIFIQGAPDAVVVVEIPLLAEGGRSKEYDGVILVTAPEDVRVARLVEAGRYDYDEAVARMMSQVDDGEREKLADWTVDNGGDREETIKQVKKIYQALVSSP
jgi:dephospho-CoA kinase